MENTAVERLKVFLSYLKIGQNKFESNVGWSRGYISNIKSSIGSDKLADVITEYPELNIVWLITGKGNMLKPETQNSSLIASEPQPEYNLKSTYTLQLENENKRLIADNQRKQELIDSFLSGAIIVTKKNAV